jgi:hypothetical protein
MSTLSGGPNIITDGLVLYLDAGNTYSYTSGSTVWNDLSRSQTSGSLINGPTFNTGSGGSIVFDGTNDYVDCGNSSIFNTPNTLTLGVWVKFNNFSSSPIIIGKEWCNGSQWSYSLSMNTDGRLAYVFDSDGNCASTTGIYESSNVVCVVGTWYYLSIVHTTSSINLYSNGNNISGQLTGSYGTIYNSTSPVLLGAYRNAGGTYSNFLNGNIVITQIYNRALSASEVLQNYNATKGRFGL